MFALILKGDLIMITKEALIGEVLDKFPQVAPLFNAIGMHCLGCPASRGESIEQACAVHGVDCDELLKKLNAAVAAFKK